MSSTLCNYLNVVPHLIPNELEFERMNRNLDRAMIEKSLTEEKISSSGNDKFYTNSSSQTLEMTETDFDLKKKTLIDDLTRRTRPIKLV